MKINRPYCYMYEIIRFEAFGNWGIKFSRDIAFESWDLSGHPSTETSRAAIPDEGTRCVEKNQDQQNLARGQKWIIGSICPDRGTKVSAITKNDALAVTPKALLNIPCPHLSKRYVDHGLFSVRRYYSFPPGITSWLSWSPAGRLCSLALLWHSSIIFFPVSAVRCSRTRAYRPSTGI